MALSETNSTQWQVVLKHTITGSSNREYSQAESAQRQLRDNQLSSAADIDRIRGDYQHQLAHSKKQQEELRQAIDALGKAIALMHRDGTS